MTEVKEFKLPEPIPLDIDGKTYFFHINNYALIELGNLLGVSPLHCHTAVTELGATDPVQALVYIIYAGVIGNEKREGNFNHGIEIKTFAKYMADADINKFAPVWDAFKASTDMGEFLATLKSDSKKKVKK